MSACVHSTVVHKKEQPTIVKVLFLEIPARALHRMHRVHAPLYYGYDKFRA